MLSTLAWTAPVLELTSVTSTTTAEVLRICRVWAPGDGSCQPEPQVVAETVITFFARAAFSAPGGPVHPATRPTTSKLIVAPATAGHCARNGLPSADRPVRHATSPAALDPPPSVRIGIPNRLGAVALGSHRAARIRTAR